MKMLSGFLQSFWNILFESPNILMGKEWAIVLYL